MFHFSQILAPQTAGPGADVPVARSPLMRSWLQSQLMRRGFRKPVEKISRVPCLVKQHHT